MIEQVCAVCGRPDTEFEMWADVDPDLCTECHRKLVNDGVKNIKSPTINALVSAAHHNAVNKGWWDEERSFAEIAMLIVTEIAEAVEDYRAGHAPTNVWYEYKYDDVGSVYQELSIMEHSNGIVKAAEKSVTDGYTILGKPCGIPSELADVVIRVFDYCGRAGINLEAAIREKMAYNATRPHRHGGKVL